MKHIGFSLAVIALTAGVLAASFHFNRTEFLWGLTGIGLLLYRWLDTSESGE